MMTRGEEIVIVMKGPLSKFTGYFQGQANLDAGEVVGYYYNSDDRVTFKNQSCLRP